MINNIWSNNFDRFKFEDTNQRKITGFGSAAAYTCVLGKDNAARIFRKTLAEEKEINNELTELAESEINKMAKVVLLTKEILNIKRPPQ